MNLNYYNNLKQTSNYSLHNGNNNLTIIQNINQVKPDKNTYSALKSSTSSGLNVYHENENSPHNISYATASGIKKDLTAYGPENNDNTLIQNNYRYFSMKYCTKVACAFAFRKCEFNLKNLQLKK